MEHDPWITLALAVVYQATLDAQNGHPALASEAKQWLKITGVSWCQILNVPDSALSNWAGDGFQITERQGRNWRYQ